MPFKIDDQGHIVLTESGGKKLPVFVHPDGKEAPFDADGALSATSRLSGEARAFRERAEAAEGKLRGFDGIDDAAAAIKALGIVKNLDEKKLIDAGEVEKVKAEVARALQAKIDQLTSDYSGLEETYFREKLTNAFSASKVIGEKFIIPADLVMARFGQQFGFENGRPYATDEAGNKIYSRERPGELADVDEALMALVERYPYRDQILKGSGHSGGGAPAGGGGGGGGKKTISRADLLKMDPAAASAAAREQGTVIVD